MRRFAVFWLFLMSGFTLLAQTQDSLSRLSPSEQLGWALDYFPQRHILDDPLAFYEQVYQQHQNHDQVFLLARYLGIIYYEKGNYQKSLTLYLQSLDGFTRQNNPTERAKTLNELAILELKQKKFDKALAYLQESEDICTQTRDTVCISTSIDNRGLALMRLQRIEEAKACFERVLELRLQSKDSVGLGYVYNNLGWVADSQGDIESATNFVQSSTRIRLALGDLQGAIVNLNNIGEIYFGVGRYAEALQKFEESLDRLDRSGIVYPDFRAYLYGQLAKTHQAIKDYAQAYQFLEQEKKLRDSLLNERTLTQLNELEAKYELSEKERQIESQRADLGQIRLQNTRLLALLIIVILLGVVGYAVFRYRQSKALNAQKAKTLVAVLEATESERKRIAQDLHDGIGQQIGGIKLAIESLPQEPFEGLLQALSDTAEQIRDLSHQMMPRVLEEKGLTDAVKELAQKTFKYSPITYDLSLIQMEDQPRLPAETELAAYRVLQELLNNIIKHAQARHVDIQLRRIKDRFIATVSDDGKGFDPQHQARGHGLLNIQARLEQVGGHIHFESEGGTLATFVIPFA
ncbi:MAG: tetratricopeptide repeat protein [Bernardetiaceae bacterium]